MTFNFTIEEGLGANTSLSVFLDSSQSIYCNISGPGGFVMEKSENTDFFYLTLPETAQVIPCHHCFVNIYSKVFFWGVNFLIHS